MARNEGSWACSSPFRVTITVKMADNSSLEDTGQHLDSWEQVFQSILQLLDEYEHHRHTLNAAVRENILFLTRMENVVVVLQQVLSVPAIRSLECNAFLEEILRNMRHLYLQWMSAETDSRCTNVAVYSLECPAVILNSSSVILEYPLNAIFYHPPSNSPSGDKQHFRNVFPREAKWS